MPIRNIDLAPPVEVRPDSEVQWVDVMFHHLWRSKYKTSERRRSKPHDWWIEIEVMVESKLPYELTCLNHFYVTIKRELIEEQQPKQEKRILVVLDIVACNKPIELEVHYDTIKENPMKFYNYLVNLVKENCGRRLSKLTIQEWLKVDLGYWFPELYPKFEEVAKKVERISTELFLKGLVSKLNFPYIIKHATKTTTVETVFVPTLMPTEKEVKTYESNDQFQDAIASKVDSLIDELIDEFISNNYSMPIALEYKEETEGGYERLKTDCKLSTSNVITGKLYDVSIIETNTRLYDVSFRRSNNLDIEPVPYRYWEEQLHDFLQSNMNEIINAIVNAYVEHLEDMFSRGGE